MRIADLVMWENYKINSNAVDDTIPWQVRRLEDSGNKVMVLMRQAGAKKDRPGNTLLVPPERIVEPWADYAARKAEWAQESHARHERDRAMMRMWERAVTAFGRVFADGVAVSCNPPITVEFKDPEALLTMLVLLERVKTE